MNEKDLKVAIDQLTAMSDFALDLKEKLTIMLTAPVKEELTVAKIKEAVTQAKAVKPTMDEEPEYTIIEEKAKPIAPVLEIVAPAPIVTVDLVQIAKDYELNGMKIGELREYLDGYEVAYPDKAKKGDLINIFAQAIADGTIPLDEDETPVEDAPATIADIPAPIVFDNDDIVETEASDERIEAENKVEDNIRASYPKKLKPNAVKKFLKTYYDGDAEMDDLDELEEDELLEMYIEIHQALVDDEGTVTALEEAYFRDGAIFCCGKQTVEMEDSANIYCECCGNEFSN